MSDYDVIVVGAGVAGLTAAMTAGRYGLRTILVDQMGVGGQTINVDRIENYPGFPQGISGYDLGPLIQEQAEAAGVEFMMDEVRGLATDGEERLVIGAENELRGKTVIIAAGSSMRTLGIPGEAEFLGKGVAHCASCDAAFFAGQPVAVVGGGDSALDEAVVLAQQVSSVRVFHHGPTVQSQKILVEKAVGVANIELVPNTAIEEIIGEDAVSAIRVHDTLTGETRVEALNGVFIYVGLEPNTVLLKGLLDLDAGGHIVTDIMMRSSVAGIFAAGDIRQHSVAQLAAAAGDGATAAVAAYRYITSPSSASSQLQWPAS